MSPGDTLGLLIVVLLPTILLMHMARRFFAFREKQLEATTSLAVEKAAQNAQRTHELEQRVRVLEQIVTDGGVQTAAQIDALRKPLAPAVEDKRK